MRLVFHVLSKEGDLKDTTFVNDQTSVQPIVDFLEQYTDEEIFVFFVDFVYGLSPELVQVMSEFGFVNEFNALMQDEDAKRFSQFAGAFTRAGQKFFDVISPENGEMHFGLKVIEVEMSKSVNYTFLQKLFLVNLK